MAVFSARAEHGPGGRKAPVLHSAIERRQRWSLNSSVVTFDLFSLVGFLPVLFE